MVIVSVKFFLIFILDMNLLKTRYLSTEDQDVFTKYIGQSKFSTNAVNFSPLDNQGKK